MRSSLDEMWIRVLAAALVLVAAQGCGGDDGDEGDDGMRATEPLPDGDPIEAPSDEWTWVDFPEARCMDDSPTGLAVRITDSPNVIIVIQGGGACFNTATCLAVANANGYGEAQFSPSVAVGLLDSADADNPFRDWSMVFVPYCSGDIFSGAAEDGTGFEGRTQMGYLNVRHFLTRLVPTFADAERVVLSGYSAGGFAASFNWIQAIEGWGPDVRIDVLNDSGPPLGEEYLTPCQQQRLAEVWNWSANVPDSCEDCDLAGGHVNEPVLRWSVPYTQQFRHALISSTEDSVMKLFNSFGLDDCATLDSGLGGLLGGGFPPGLYTEGLMDLQDNIFADHPNAEAFIVDSEQHVWTTESPGTVESEGVVLRDWIEDFLDPDAEWETVAPF